MTTTSITRRMSAAVVLASTAAVLALPSALAAGEPKNVTPFTDPVAGRGLTVTGGAAVSAGALIVGEAKNQIPFTIGLRSHGSLSLNLRGEPKNEFPFVRK
jgi:hypothetical protein